MIVYSKKIVQFITEIKHTAKIILNKEISLKVFGDRFYDSTERCSYPLKIVIFNNKRMLGYFDPNFYELGFHEALMHSSKKQLHDIIRHELAHYVSFIFYGNRIDAHGAEFKAFCLQKGWGEEVYKATCCLETEQDIPFVNESGIFRKIHKLMALASSSNKNEAEQAMIKAQQLLLKHNIETTYLGAENAEKTYLKRIMKQKKENAKMRSIAHILETFFVNIVYSRAGEFIYLEILGSEVNLEIAEYVAGVLDYELDKLWNQAKKQASLKGMIAKNSFFLGLAKGYCNKIQALKREYSEEVVNALIVIEKKLINAKSMVYERLSKTKSHGNHCRESSAIGEQMGRQLNINPALNRPSNTSKLLIGHK